MSSWKWRLRVGRSFDGLPYGIMEHYVPRINDQYLDTAVYIYHTRADAKNGVRIGGSGFLVGVPLDDKFHCLYVVTNKHVIKKGLVIRLNTQEGATDIIETLESDWVTHPDGDDLAIYPIVALSHQFKYKFCSTKHFLTQDIVRERDIGAGDDTFLVGRFVNHEGRQQNRPTARFGNIAMMPWEPIEHPCYHTMQESFLVESHSQGGYSGSAVFVWMPIEWRILGTLTKIGLARSKSEDPFFLGPWLLGIDWCHIPNKDGSNTGMMGVIPAWRLYSMLDSPKERERQEEIAMLRKKLTKESTVVLDTAERTFTKDDMKAALRKVSRRKPSKPDRASSGT